METNDKLQALINFNQQLNGKNYFEILGIDENTPEAEIRSAYFGLLKKYGADYFHQVTEPDARAAIDNVNKMLRQAYDTLSRTESRERYIAELHGEPRSLSMDIAAVFEVEQAMTQARSLMERGEFAVAAQKLEKVVQRDRKSIEARARMAYAQYMLLPVDASGKRDQAKVNEMRNTITDALGTMESVDFLRVYLGDIENLEGNSDKALSWYKQAAKINPGNLQAKRGIKLLEDRSKRAKKEPEKPKSLFERIKAVLTRKM